MSKVLSIAFLLCVTCVSNAQIDWTLYSDSLALESRSKADKVLSSFDSLLGKKLLFSIDDKDYYIIIQTKDHFNEFYVKIDSSRVVICKEVGSDERLDKEIKKLQAKFFLTKRKRLLLKRLVENEHIIDTAFDLKQYQMGLITSVPDATIIRGPLSYFVIKDEDSISYGEYHLEVFTLPCPINPSLWAYLFRELINIIAGIPEENLTKTYP